MICFAYQVRNVLEVGYFIILETSVFNTYSGIDFAKLVVKNICPSLENKQNISTLYFEN